MGLTIGQQALRGGNDGDAQPAENLRQGVGLRVDTQTGLADTTHARNGTLTVLAVLEVENECLADLALLGIADGVIGDVTLLLEDLGNSNLDLGGCLLYTSDAADE